MTRLYELTRYPKLYENTRWGSLHKDREPRQDHIIINRNTFAEEFKLTSFIGHDLPKITGKLFDHCESYKTQNGIIFLASPYESNSIGAEVFGFSEYLQLYHHKAKSYIKLFSSKADYDDFMKLHD